MDLTNEKRPLTTLMHVVLLSAGTRLPASGRILRSKAIHKSRCFPNIANIEFRPCDAQRSKDCVLVYPQLPRN